MRINHNISALNSYRVNSINNNNQQNTLQKISTGQRINKAGDDSAGLAISEKMRGQIRGLNQATRNLQDGISMLQVAEGGLNEIHSMLQRGRELAVQASNGTLTTSDKQQIQSEMSEIISSIDNIANSTNFNQINLLNVDTGLTADMQAIVDGLQKSWLKESEDLITNYFGITGDNANLEVVFTDGQPYLAAVSYNLDGAGKAINQQLLIDVSDFLPANWPNGGNAPYYDDRIIAHEMVHAVMGRTMNFGALPSWFKEGTAEFIHGADERLNADISWANVVGGDGIANIVAEISGWGVNNSGGDPNWNISWDYSAGYAATRFMHSKIISTYGGTGVRDVMTQLSGGATFNAALTAVSGGAWAGEAGFLADFAANGAAYIAGMNLADADTGAIGGANADGGGRTTTATGVIPDVAGPTPNTNPLAGFTEIWPSAVPVAPLAIQTGANSGQKMDITLSNVKASKLGISGSDVTVDSQAAITSMDTAINLVSAERSRLGAIQNRLEHNFSINEINSENTTASESRLRDADIAKEMMSYTKNNILVQASMAMMAQANQNPQNVLTLLRAG